MKNKLTEKQKMLKGMLFMPNDNTLEADRLKAKKLTGRFNNLPPEKEAERVKIIKKLFCKTGSKLWVAPPFQCDYGYNIEVGENFGANHNIIMLDIGKIKFGDNVLIGPNAAFYAVTHPLDPEVRKTWLESGKPITVGDDVWIGGGAIILQGVTIGSNVVIGAGSVVTKDIPSNSMAVGNPCKVIKKLKPAGKKK